MSRIGKQPVQIPDKVKVDIKGTTVSVEGPKGKVSKTFAPVVKIEQKARRFPDELDVTGLRSIRSLRAFDDRYTVPLHGFRDAADYWAQASSRQYLPRIAVPTLLLNARNDPFLTPESFPTAEAQNNPALFLEAPESGGHVGFLDCAGGLKPWFEQRVAEFLG